MALSKLLATVEKMVLDKKMFWSSDRKWRVQSVESKLNDGSMKIEDAMKKIRDEFNQERKEGKADEFGFFRAIEKEIGINLRK